MLHTSLSSRPWRLARTDPIPVDAPLDDPGCLADWLPARVPGSIQRDLMTAGRLPDLHNVLDLDETLRPLVRMRVVTLPLPDASGLLTLHLTGPGVDVVNDYPLPWPFPPEQRSRRLRTRLEARALHWLLRW